MFLLGFDAATPGRLAMIEEKTLDSARYLENIKNGMKAVIGFMKNGKMEKEYSFQEWLACGM